MPRHIALIPAAGSGARMGAEIPKQYLPLLGQPMLVHTVTAFLHHPQIDLTVLVVSADDQLIEQAFPAPPEKLRILRCGGASRAESVNNGLQALAAEVDAADWVLVHDAARPGLNAALISQLIAALENETVGGLLALPVVDTVKRAGAHDDDCERVQQTIAREHLWLAQTPQMFRYQLLHSALAMYADDPAITDEAGAIEASGLRARLVPGHPCNLKVTVPADMMIAEMYLRAAAQEHIADKNI